MLTTAPLAPDVVPDVKPTIIGAPGSMVGSTWGVACIASSQVSHPVASPRTTTRSFRSSPAARAAESSMSTWS